MSYDHWRQRMGNGIHFEQLHMKSVLFGEDILRANQKLSPFGRYQILFLA